MSNIYTFCKPLDMMRQLASALTVRNCIVSGSGSDSACSASVAAAVIPNMFQPVTEQHFRNVDSMISAVAPYFCNSNGSRWSMNSLESACGASHILPDAVGNPLPAEWLSQRFDMISRLKIAAGGVMTVNIDGYAESTHSYEDALSSAIANASAAAPYSDCKASRCLIFDRIGSDYCVSAVLTVSGSALSPTDTPVWGNPQKIFRLSAFRNTHDSFYAGNIIVNGGTMTILEHVNIINTGTSGTYRFLNPIYHTSASHEDAGMEEFWDDSAPVLLDYNL